MSKTTVVTTYEVRCERDGGPVRVRSWSEARRMAERFDEICPDCAPHHACRVKTTTTVEATWLPAKKAKP